MRSFGVLQKQLLSAVVEHLDDQLQSHRFDSFFSVFEAGRGNDLFLNANIRQNNQCAVSIEEKMYQPLSFIAFSFFLFVKRERREEKKNASTCVSF